MIQEIAIIIVILGLLVIAFAVMIKKTKIRELSDSEIEEIYNELKEKLNGR